TPHGDTPMRLATLATAAHPRLVARVGDHYVDLAATDPTLPTTARGLFAAGPDALAAAARVAAAPNAPLVPVPRARYLPPVPDPGKVLCIGLNYRDHAIEGGKAIPAEPVLFGKFANALIGAGDPIVLPKVSQKVDYEAELVVVLGKR